MLALLIFSILIFVKSYSRSFLRMSFDNNDVESAVNSLSRRISLDNTNIENKIDIRKYRSHLIESAHLSHKDWTLTESYSDKLAQILGGIDNKEFQLLFERVLNDGNFDTKNSINPTTTDSTTVNDKPWIVLVTGLNGIRKTTSLYQPWFQELLHSCIKPPTNCNGDNIELQKLPTGRNSFYRQLDYMIATLAVEEFEKLYKSCDTSDDPNNFDNTQIEDYSKQKAVIFGKYRMIAEQLGKL